MVAKSLIEQKATLFAHYRAEIAKRFAKQYISMFNLKYVSTNLRCFIVYSFIFQEQPMTATRITSRMIAVIASLCFVAACDDDERKAKEMKYEVTIYVSDHIQGEIVPVKPERKFAKPRIEIHAPEGVTIVPKETKPRKTTVVDFAPIAFAALLTLFLAAAAPGLLNARRRLG